MLIKRGLVNDDLEMRERMFVEAFAGGRAEKAHFDELASLYSVLSIAARHKGDEQTLAMCEGMFMAMQNIRARHAETGVLTAEADELALMGEFCTVYRDFWLRQPISLYAKACAAYAKVDFQ